MSELTYDFLNEQNEILRDGTDAAFVKASNNILKERGSTKKLIDGQGRLARQFVEKIARELGNKKDYLRCATLLFGRNYFDARPECTRDVHRVFHDYDFFGICGASSMSKSYCLGIILVIDYWLDPDGTKIRVASISKEHLEGNLFSSMIDCVENAIIDMDFECSVNNMWIRKRGMKKLDYVIRGQCFKQGDEKSTGRFRGVKPTPRAVPHPVFGKMTRVRIFLDEASDIPGGVFKDLDSPMASAGDGNEGRVKCFYAFNPTDASHHSGQYSAPKDGIDSLDPDFDYEWESAEGFHILRLDGAKSENVIAGEEIYLGIQSKKRFMQLLDKGPDSASYWVFGRGFWPRKGALWTIIPMVYITKQRGELVFPHGSTNIGSVDISLGGDKCIMTLGRYGLASGVIIKGHEQETFRAEEKPTMRPCIQVDAQIQIDPGEDTISLAKEIKAVATQYQIKPEWLCVDNTAVGQGPCDTLRAIWGNVLGINWQCGASDIKVLNEDDDIPENRYVSVSAEMWYATRDWLEHGFLWLSPNIPSVPLYYQLSNRRRKAGLGRGGRFKVEEKYEYAKRDNKGQSPDEADSFIQLVQLCRIRGEYLPSITGKFSSNAAPDRQIDWKKYQSKVDQPDNLCQVLDDA